MITEVDLSGTPCFAPEATLKDLKKVNFIFGPNGTGKTSITRILSEGPDDPRITHSANDPSNREILVLNSTYIENTFQEAENGIFFLGEQSISNEQDIECNKKQSEQLLTEIDSLTTEIEKQKAAQSNAAKKLLNSIWDERGSVPDKLSSCLDGYNKSKTKLRDKVKEIRQHPLPTNDTLPTTLDELAAQEKGLLTTTLETAPRISTIPQFPKELNDLPELLQTPLIPAADSPLSDLISQIQHSDWVREGKEIMESHQDVLDGNCPFCQQKTPQDFGDNLTMLWDHSYDTAITKLHSHLGTLRTSIQRMSDFKANIREHQLTDVAEYAQSTEFDAIEKALSEAHALLEKKLEKQSQSFDTTEDWNIDRFNGEIRQIGERLNSLIDEHNAKVNDQDNLKREFREQFWKIFSHHTCGDAFEIFESIVEGETGTTAKITALEEEISKKDQNQKELTERIKAAERGRMDIHPAIEHINRALSGIGLTAFELGASTDDFITEDHPGETKSDAYVLLRNNENGEKERTDVSTLSDGERNLICFLYFFHQFHKDAAHTDKKFTVVIDDPINAMDGLSSFITSGFIRELIRSILQLSKTPEHKFVDQLIILTHSTRFHIETSYELPTDGKKARQCAFYEIRRKRPRTGSGTCAKSIISEPTQTTSIENEYSQLWKHIRNTHDSLTGTSNTGHFETLFIGNAMRRIIEAYFIHLGNYTSISELGRSSDPATRALMAFCNNNSHDALDMNLHTICSIPLDQLFAAFGGIFTSNNAEDHYRMMMRTGRQEGEIS